MKKFFKKIAGYFVTIYANKLYQKAVKEAEKVHAELGERIYVASSLSDISKLVILNRDKFRKMKRSLFIQKHYISNLMEGAWYYTADRSGKNGLAPADKEARRIAFINHLLERAKLV